MKYKRDFKTSLHIIHQMDTLLKRHIEYEMEDTMIKDGVFIHTGEKYILLLNEDIKMKQDGRIFTVDKLIYTFIGFKIQFTNEESYSFQDVEAESLVSFYEKLYHLIIEK